MLEALPVQVLMMGTETNILQYFQTGKILHISRSFLIFNMTLFRYKVWDAQCRLTYTTLWLLLTICLSLIAFISYEEVKNYCQARVQVQGLSQISNKRPGPGACS